MRNLVVDPVCGLEINSNVEQNKAVYKGKTYYFCSKECKDEFNAAPEDYIGGDE